MTCPIFTYHSIDESGSVISTSRANFRQQMHYLWRKGYSCISLKMYIDSSMANADPIGLPKQFVLTFDDGYKNNFEVALPILKEFGFTATVFLVTGGVGRSADWEMSAGVPSLPLLTWNEIRELQVQGMDVQPHGVTHRDLTSLDRDAIRAEISDSRRAIEDELGSRADLFSYPYGKWNDTVVEVVKDAGFRGAVTVDFGFNRVPPDPFRIRRIASRRFRRYPGMFRLCLSRSGCHLTSLAVTVRRLTREGSA